MKVYLYNTLTRSEEEFIPLKPGCVSMYSCGPTVYNYAHIGNMRTYVFTDTLTRMLRFFGYDVNSIMNITDVGHLTDDGDNGADKMAQAASREKKTPWQIAEYYTKVFLEDLGKLNIVPPNIMPRVTEHIDEMIEFVLTLQEKGYTYETSDGIYFDISKFPSYGKLSRANLEEQLAGARVEVNEEKRHPADFALWKKAPKEHIMQWPSPWGMGYPGWHIECSTLCYKYLGDRLDIHTGGVDHIPIHHENEIAQSEALLDHPAVNYWMHAEFMMVNGGKMSKSLGNTYTVSDLAKMGYHPLAFRYFCLNAHYRNKLNFTFEAMGAAQTAYRRLLECALAHKNADSIQSDELDSMIEAFDRFVSKDLNLPAALGILWNMARLPVKSKKIYDALCRCDSIMGLKLDECEIILEELKPEEVQIPQEIKQLVELRQAARSAKNWSEADRLRDEITALGYIVKDSADGPRIEKSGL